MPIDTGGWTSPSQQTLPNLPARRPGQPLPGTLNEMFGTPSAEPPPGLVIPTAPPSDAPQVQSDREPSLGEIGRRVAGMAGQTLSLPRLAAWNVGPALVGRTGQGPQSGAELFNRLGLNYDAPWQRAIGHGLGRGLDLVADPMNLVGMGAGRGAAGATAEGGGALTRRLEQLAGPESGLQGMSFLEATRLGSGMTPAGAAALRRANTVNPNNMPPVAIARPRGAAAPQSLAETVPGGGAPSSPATIQRPGQLPFTPGAEFRPIPEQGIGYRSPTPSGTPGSVPAFGYDADALRSLQLNSPRFNPAEPAFGLGTGQFTQDASQAARYGLEGPSGLVSERFMSGATPTASPLIDRLRRMATQPN